MSQSRNCDLSRRLLVAHRKKWLTENKSNRNLRPTRQIKFMNDELEVLPDEPVRTMDVMSGDALASLERASIDIQITTARKFPRVLKVVVHKMEQAATLDEDTAASCFYSLPRGGKNIEGPSIRLAEIALNSYGNLRFAARNIAVVTHGDQPHVVCQAVVHDLENNVLGAVEKRRRITKKKSKDRIDEDDINLAVNACSSVALRDAAFKVIPLALIKPVYQKARKVAIGDATSLTVRRNKAIEAFNKMGVVTERILLALDKKIIDEIGLEELATLTGIRTALKEGASDIDDVFPVLPKPGATGSAPKIVPKDEGDGLPAGGTTQATATTTTAKPKTAKAKEVVKTAATNAAASTPAAATVRQPDNTKRGGGATLVEEPLDEPLPPSGKTTTAPPAEKVEKTATPPPAEVASTETDGDSDVL